MNFVVFIIVLFALFGPKLAGVLDLSLLGGGLGILLLTCAKKIRFGREYIIVVMLVASVVAYSMLAVLFAGVEDTHPVLRHFRALISTVLLGVVFYNLAATRTYSSGQLTNTLIAVLLVNAVVVMVSIALPEIKPLLANLYGFNKSLVPLRSFGLTAGYDTAGYLCIIGGALSAIAIYYKRNIGYTISFLSFMVAAMFTSRSTMLLVLVLMTSVCAVFLLRGRWTLKVASMSYIIIGVGIAILYVVPLILATFGWGVVEATSANYTGSFAATDLSAWKATMWTLPDSPAALFLGTGETIETSDIGYVEIVFMIGIVGLLLVVSIYFYMFMFAMRLRRSASRGELLLDLEGWVLLRLLLIVLICLYVFNIKNLYFLTRGYHELIVILFFFLAGLKATKYAGISDDRV